MLEWDLALSLKATTMGPVADVFFAPTTTSIWGPLRRLGQAVGQGGARGEPALPGRQAGGQVKAAVKLEVQGDLARQGKLAGAECHGRAQPREGGGACCLGGS